jgi:glycosyltransferase involved in cell wall biosynthesis
MIITTSYPDDAPGMEAAGSFVEDFAMELSKLVPVSVIAASRSDSTRTDGTLTVRRFAVPILPLSSLRAKNPMHWPAIAKSLRSGRIALGKAIREHRPEHILALWVLPSGWWARTEGRRHGVAFSTWALGSDIWSLARLPGVRGVLQHVLRAATLRYADGVALCKDVERISGEPCSFLASSRKLPERTGVSPAETPPYKLAFLGRWHPNKGADLLMGALQSLQPADWEKIEEVRIYGGGPLQEEIQAAAQQLVSAGRPVATGGYLDKAEAARLIDWADYLLLPSRIESIPVIFSDAAQLGTALIATPVGDLPALSDRYEFGVLAASASETDFCRAIRSALADKPGRFAAGLNAAAAEFNLETIVRRFLDDIASAR